MYWNIKHFELIQEKKGKALLPLYLEMTLHLAVLGTLLLT